MKLHYKKTLILGICFLAMSFTWVLYNSYIPIFLKRFFSNNSIIGFVMSIDNYAGLFILPIFGVLSDKVNTRIGKRMPFLFFGMIGAAVILSIIPEHKSMVSLIALIIAFNIVVASFRAPLISLMPDLTIEQQRSSANGIINLMAGAGAILAYMLGMYLFNMDKAYPFYLSSALIIISLIIMYIFIKEKRDSLVCCEIPDKLLDSSKVCIEIDEDEESEKANNVLLLLVSIFFMFCALNAIEIFFGVYGRNYLGIGESGSARAFTIFSLFIAISSLPAGLIGDKIGRKLAIIIGQSAMVLIFIALFFTTSKSTFEMLIGICGIFWALIYINVYPLLVGMTERNNTGRFTGYYYVFISLSSIITPLVMDFLIETFGFNIFFIYSGLSFTISLILFVFVNDENNYNSCNNAIQSDM